jgi:hypothetical protein
MVRSLSWWTLAPDGGQRVLMGLPPVAGGRGALDPTRGVRGIAVLTSKGGGIPLTYHPARRLHKLSQSNPRAGSGTPTDTASGGNVTRRQGGDLCRHRTKGDGDTVTRVR